jgi:hypothetical protein
MSARVVWFDSRFTFSMNAQSALSLSEIGAVV